MFIYAIANDVNEKIYVGLHTGESLRHRLEEHRFFSKSKAKRLSLLHCAMRKHGCEKFHIIAVWSGRVPLDKLKTLEVFFIRSFGSKTPNGYNMTDGGEGTKGYRHSQEECTKRSERMRGNIPAHKGKKRDPEIGRRISAAKTGKHPRPHRKPNKAKQMIGNQYGKGYKHTAEQLAARTARTK